MKPYLDPQSGMLAREPFDPARESIGKLKLRPDPQPEPCIHCGTPTDRTVIGALCEKVKQPGEWESSPGMSPGSIGYSLHPSTWEVLHVCDECERRRCIAQWKAVAANLECYPHLRDAAIAALAGAEQVEP